MADTTELVNGPAGSMETQQADSISIYNATRGYSDVYAKFCVAYIIPLVLLITLVTNTLVVMVLSQRHMRTPTNIVLFTMAIVDLLTLLSPSPWYFYIFTLGYDNLLYPPIACYSHYIMTDVIPVFFHTSSIWLALLLASQRYIYVCHPTLASTWCTVPRVRKAIIIIILIAFAHQATKFFEYTFTPTRTEINGSEQDACKTKMPEWIRYLNIDPYYITYFTFRIAFVFIIPIFSLITLNFLLFRALRRADDKRTRLLKTKFKSIGARSSVGNAEIIKHSSFTHNNNGCLTTNIGTSQGFVSHFSKSIGRKSRGSAIDQQLNSTSSNDTNQQANQKVCDQLTGQRKQRGMFSMGPFQLKFKQQNINKTGVNRAANLQEPQSPINMLRVSSPNIQASDTKLSGSVCNERFATSERACGSGGFSLRSRLSRAKQFMRGGNGESNASRSITTNQSNRESGYKQNSNNCGHIENQRPPSATTTTTKSKPFIMSSDRLSGQNNSDEFSGDGNDNSLTFKDGGGGGDEEFPSCVDCATCQRNFESECRHCSAAAANEGATVVAGRHIPNSQAQHQIFNRTVSQCSSLLGVATNTTTNEDGSSCMVTQNASSSMFVSHCDGTLDTTEVTSMREQEETYDDDEENEIYADQEEEGNDDDKIANSLRADEESRLLDKESPSVAKPSIGTRMSIPLAKSGNTDSRLVCSCVLPPPTGGASMDEPGSDRLRSASTRQKRDCRECCMVNDCQRTHTAYATAAIQQAIKLTGGADSSLVRAKRNARDQSKATKCAASTCSSSEPCINCNSTNSFRRRTSRNIGRANIDNDNDKAGGRPQCGRDARMPTSQSDYGNGEGVRNEVKSIYDGNEIAITNTTTTTTTTLYSNNATSIGSLLQVQPAVSGFTVVATTATTSATTAAAGASKRPSSQVNSSFANPAGRGSRTTLISSLITNPTPGQLPVQPPTLIGGVGNLVAANASASVRTMDSNRTTLMLIVVVTVFLVIEVPNAIATILHLLVNSFEWFANYDASWIYNVRLFTNFFMTVSSPVNFTIYCSMSKKFRETFRELLLGHRDRHRRSHRFIYQQPQVSQCPQTQMNFNQDNQTTAVAIQALKPNDSNNDNSTNVGIVQQHNEFTTTVSGLNHSAATAGVMKFPSYRRASSQQQECEL